MLLPEDLLIYIRWYLYELNDGDYHKRWIYRYYLLDTAIAVKGIEIIIIKNVLG